MHNCTPSDAITLFDCRAALRCVNAWYPGSPSSSVAAAAPLVISPRLYAHVLARGNKEMAEDILQQSALPADLQAQAASPFADTSRSGLSLENPASWLANMLSARNAASLYVSALRIGGGLTWSFVWAVRGPDERDLDPALAVALDEWWRNITIDDGSRALSDPWLPAALMQLKLYESCNGDAELAALLPGDGAVPADYLR